MPVEVGSALVLAGGESSRMGRDKAALEFDGETQLARAVRLAESVVGQARVSIRPEQAGDPLRAGFDCLVDQYEGVGPLAGILTALESSARPWLVLACDLPMLNEQTLRYLVQNVNPDAIATAYRSETDGLPEPLCAVWMPAALTWLREAVDQNKRCPRKILIRADAPLLTLPVQGALTNVNTPADLASIPNAVGAASSRDKTAKESTAPTARGHAKSRSGSTKASPCQAREAS